IHVSLQLKLQGWKEDNFTRADFPPNFIFGAGTSAYQVEGAVADDGRKPSIWDTYTHSGKMLDGSTGDISADQYHHYKEDVRLMYKMGLDAYRFSISWSRLIPDGKGTINPKGLEYYNNLINELILHGIEPHVTLYHFDLPQSLEDAYGGWINPQIIEDFRAFSEVCFTEFGDRVKYWTTFNEPNAFPSLSYDIGLWPPQRCSYPFGFGGGCSAGDSTVEPYIVAHHILLSHAETVKLYREKFQAKQKGFMSIVILMMWLVPLTNSSKDIAATQRGFDFQNGWFLDPLLFGDYPSSMKKIAGSRLPTFTKQQSEILKGSLDLVGVNHYGSYYVSDSSHHWVTEKRDYIRDLGSNMTVLRDGILIGKLAPTGLPVVPWGLQALLEYLKQHYGNPPIIIYENGYGTRSNQSVSISEALNDRPRMEYLHDYLESMLAAIGNGSNTRGYFVWTLLDNFEFIFGYRIRYGLYYVDFKDKNLKRYQNLSGRWAVYRDRLHRDPTWGSTILGGRGRIHSLNMVRMWDFCAEGDQRLLVYEYISKDSQKPPQITKNYDSRLSCTCRQSAAIDVNGVDKNSWDRALLRSAKPALHANVDCTPLIAAIVSRQAPVVKYLLEVGAKTDCKVSLGAWSWDTVSGEELRVGASLAEPYNEAWCVVEYYEAKGEVLKMLLGYISPNNEHQGRTLICHAILCRNSGASHVLLDAGANAEFCVRTNNGHEFRPLHLAARMGCLAIVKQLIEHGCDLNARTEMGETALMLCAKGNHHECFMDLLVAGADLGLINRAGQSAVSMVEESGFESSFHQVLWATIKDGKKINSSNLQVFSSLHFVARFGDSMVLQKLLEQLDINLNEQDKNGYSAAMVAVKEGHIEVFKILIFAGADVKLKSKKGEIAFSLSQLHGSKDHFERVLLDVVLANILKEEEFKALHFADQSSKYHSRI
ncbi:hypothetical protein KI387_001129, partial [Taxus chinensis]